MKQRHLQELYPQNKLVTMMHRLLCYSDMNRMSTNYEILMVNDPFIVADDVLMNITTKAVMPDPVKNAIIQRNSIGQEMFDKFVQERLVDKEMSIWSPKKKVKLLIWYRRFPDFMHSVGVTRLERCAGNQSCHVGMHFRRLTLKFNEHLENLAL